MSIVSYCTSCSDREQLGTRQRTLRAQMVCHNENKKITVAADQKQSIKRMILLGIQLLRKHRLNLNIAIPNRNQGKISDCKRRKRSKLFFYCSSFSNNFYVDVFEADEVEVYLGKRTRNFNVILDSKGPMEIHYRTISFCMLQKVNFGCSPCVA